MIDEIKNNLRGSIWRKWDLHVHTPESDGFSGDWKEFKKQLQNSDCAVIGVNDYFSVAGYKKIKEAIKNETFDLGEKIILPVIEMRMTDSLQNRNTNTNGTTHFNFHIIFSDKINVDDIESFIKSLKCGDTIVGSDYEDKTKLKIKKVSFKETLKELRGDKKFEGKFLIWLPYDEYGGIGDIDPNSDGWIKGDFIKKSHIMGSSNRNQIDFFLWKSLLKKDGNPKIIQEQFKQWFEYKKPCIKGSDSHSHMDSIGKLKDEKSNPIEKFCWIKADPTFDGLKQIIYEPEDRVKIQKENPENSKKHWKLKSLQISDSSIDKFSDQKIYFNSYLTSIIGGRGTGKSALLSLIAFLNGNSDSFMNWIKERGVLDINVEFLDKEGKIEKYTINRLSDENFSLPIYYLSQKDIESFANEEEKDAIRKSFLKTLGIDDTTYYYNDEIITAENEINNLRKINLEEKDILENLKLIAENENLKFNNNIDNIIEYFKSKKDKFSTPKTKNSIDAISKLTIKANKLKNIIKSSLSTEIEMKVKSLNEDIDKYNSQFCIFDHESCQKLMIGKINEENIQRKIKTNKDAIDLNVDKLRKECSPHITVLEKEKIDYTNIQKEIENTDKNIEKLKEYKKRLREIKEKRSCIFITLVNLFEDKKIDDDKKIEEEKQDEISYKEKIVEAENDIKSKLKKFKEGQCNLFGTIFRGIKIESGVYFDNEVFIEMCKKYFYSGNLRSVEEFFEKLKKDDYNSFFKTFDNDFLEELNELNKKELLKKDNDGYYNLLKDIYANCMNYIKVQPKIELGKLGELGNLSGGQQATLMLKLKLASGGLKKDIIILDQPENHLDNKFINDSLVDLVKELKKEKQVIIASHNANLVINADSEEIIIARMDEENNKYLSGSIENKSIIKKSIKILEGGKEAFDKRKSRYNFS